MGFKKQEKSSGGGRGRSTVEKISLRRSNSIGINSAAVEEYVSDEPEYCEIYWDAEDRQLGLHFSDEDSEDSYKVTYAEAGGGATVAPTAWLKSHGLVPEVTEQFKIETKELDGKELLVIDVDNPDSTYGSPPDEDDQVED